MLRNCLEKIHKSTNLPNGNFDMLINSIQTKMYALPDEILIYCGHGQVITTGYEKKYNPCAKII
ncbi:MAG: hypothetical protein EAZ08_00820 [Cytophagales bacterium]|nr:MAG: hypothetical protein EAZ08_00820 [Cytophagales bacterium]